MVKVIDGKRDKHDSNDKISLSFQYSFTHTLAIRTGFHGHHIYLQALSCRFSLVQ